MRKHLLCVAFLLFAIVGAEAKSRTLDRIPASPRGPMAALKAKGLSANLLGSLLDSRGRKLNPARYRTYGAHYYLLPRTAKASVKTKWAAIAAENRAYRNTVAKARAKKVTAHRAKRSHQTQSVKIVEVEPTVVKVAILEDPKRPVLLKAGEIRVIPFILVLSNGKTSTKANALIKDPRLLQVSQGEPPTPGTFIVTAAAPLPDAPNETDIEVIAIANPSVKETLHVIVQRPPVPPPLKTSTQTVFEIIALIIMIGGVAGLVILAIIWGLKKPSTTTTTNAKIT